MKNQKVKPILMVFCFCLAMLFTVNSFALSIEIPSTIQENSTQEFFDGYEGLETTVSGRVGFNYVLSTPDNKEILLGFNPNTANTDACHYTLSNIGIGWGFKIPYLDTSAQVMRLYQSDGYNYTVKKKLGSYEIVNYPAAYTFMKQSDTGLFCFEKADGSQEYFAKDGTIVKAVDAYGNTTDYFYNNGVLAKINYSDSSSISFDRLQENQNIIVSLQYQNNTQDIELGVLTLTPNSKGTWQLQSIQNNANMVKFHYNYASATANIASIIVVNEYSRVIHFNDSNPSQVKMISTSYIDGNTVDKKFYYDGKGRINRMVDGDVASEQYEYKQNLDGSLTTVTTKECQGDVSAVACTVNKYGQIIKYARDNSVLELKYNKYNKVSQEKEGSLNINYTFTSQGDVALADFSNGEKISYEYYPDGQLQKEVSNKQEVYYAPDGALQKIKTADSEVVYDDQISSGTLINRSAPSSRSAQADCGTSVLYNINSSVGVTNWHTYYNLPQDSFNCYSFAIGKTNQIYNPGNFSRRGLNINSFSGIKLNVEEDQRSLGRGIYDTDVNASVPGHCWKIALKIHVGEDYHFMVKHNAGWEFKAGKGGPVMRVLGSGNPSNVSWDRYYAPLFSTQYKVYDSNYYNSQISYMMIRD